MIDRGRSKQRATGFSLVELMVAMVLGLILIAAVLQVFVGNRQTQVIEASLARVQESGRLALEFLSEDLRQAGFYGSGDLKYSPISMMKPTAADLCVGRTEAADVLNVSSGRDWFDTFVDGAIQVYSRNSSGWTPSAPPVAQIPTSVSDNVRPGTDLISIWYAVDTGAKIGATPVTGTDNVPITYAANTNAELCFAPSELAMLSNPAGSVLFKITNAVSGCTGSVTLQHGTTGNCSNSLGPIAYDSFARVMKVVHRMYYIKDTGRTNAEGKNVYSLYRRQLSNKGTVALDSELVEGVEYLNLTYTQRKLNGTGVDNGYVRFDVDAASVDAKSIKAARIGVLVQGLDPVRSDEDDNTYTLVNGVSIAPPGSSGAMHTGGRTMRQVFNANVELRNRAQ
jgi:type IV pilus assembly protein PilW